MRCLFPIGLLLALAGAHALAQGTIPVVHTWGDLENAPMITVVPNPRVEPGKTRPVLMPVTFQLGIQSDQATSYGGVILYFIAPNSGEVRNTPSERGLFDIEVAGKQTRGLGGGSASYSEPNPVSPGTTFYAIAIPFQAAGDYVVQIVQPFQYNPKPDFKPVVLAQAKVHVQDRPDELWYPFWEIEKAVGGGAKSGPSGDGKRFAIVPINNPKGGTAIPTPPHPRPYAQLPAVGQPLPAFYPAEGSPPSVSLKMSDSTLIADFGTRIEGFFPDDNFLTRWWVNGQLVHLDPTLDPPSQMRALAAHVIFTRDLPEGIFGTLTWYTQQARFDLHFQPDWLQVKKGDQVGVQLLFCPNSFTNTDWQPFFRDWLLDSNATQPPICFSEISNKIEFTYSGDPAHPQQ